VIASLSRIDLRQAVVATVAALLGLLVGAVSAVQPKIGLLAAIGVAFVALVFVDLFFGYAAMALFAFLEVLTVVGGVSLAKVAGAVIVLAWLATASLHNDRARNFFRERPGLAYLVIAFVGWNLMSLAWAESSSAGLTSVMRYALNALLLPIGYAAVRDRRDGVRILAVLVVGATIAAVAAILIPSAPEAGYERATGTVGDPNALAAALVVGLALAVSFAANRTVRPPLRALSALSAVLCFAGIMLTLSRDGLLGLGAALLLAVLVGGRWRKPALAVCGTAVGSAVVYFGVIASIASQQRILVFGGGTGRVTLWTIALRMISAHPINGIGTGQFANSSVHYLLQPGLITRGDLILASPKVAHNTYLNVLAETGIIGGALFIAIVVFCIWCIWLAIKRFERDGDERLELLARGLLVGLGGFLVTMFFISDEYTKLLWMLLALGPIMLAVASVPREHTHADTTVVG
jgi:O-antigen ligase